MRATNSAGTWKHANQTEYIAKVHFTLQLEANCPVIEIDSLAEYITSNVLGKLFTSLTERMVYTWEDLKPVFDKLHLILQLCHQKNVGCQQLHNERNKFSSNLETCSTILDIHQSACYSTTKGLLIVK